MILDKKKTEQALGVTFKTNCISIGVDTATITGLACIKTTDTTIEIDFDVLDMHKLTDVYDKYNTAYKFFDNFLLHRKASTVVVVEDVFYGKNIKALIFMARIGMLVYTLAKKHSLTMSKFIMARDARCRLKLPGTKKKAEVQKIFLEKTGLQLDEENTIDAVILAMNGVLDETN